MRPIKFRVWDKKYGKMYYGGDIRISLVFPREDVEIMQFTGLFDKDSKEIWEGDIVKYLTAGFEQEGIVEYTGSAFMAISKGCNDKIFCCGFLDKYIEVIGNIYENRDLLNGE